MSSKDGSNGWNKRDFRVCILKYKKCLAKWYWVLVWRRQILLRRKLRGIGVSGLMILDWGQDGAQSIALSRVQQEKVESETCDGYKAYEAYMHPPQKPFQGVKNRLIDLKELLSCLRSIGGRSRRSRNLHWEHCKRYSPLHSKLRKRREKTTPLEKGKSSLRKILQAFWQCAHI